MDQVKALASQLLQFATRDSSIFQKAHRVNRRTMRCMPLIAVLSVLLISLLVPKLASAKNSNPGILPPNSKPHGLSYGAWSAEWTKWALAQPADVNPLFDTTGEHCALGQAGKVWFLAGTVFDPASTEPVIVERTCTIPTGKNLFFPILNYLWITALGDPDDKETISELLKGAFDDLLVNAALAVTIDGKAVDYLATPSIYRVTPPDLFDAPMPLNNIFEADATICDPYGSDQFVCSPNWSDGVFLMLAPLSAGQHSITIATTWFEVAYDLTVQGGKAKGNAVADATNVEMSGASPTQQNRMFLPTLSH